MTRRCVVCDEREAPPQSLLCDPCFEDWYGTQEPMTAWAANRARFLERKRARAKGGR
jgi:hypothetical protein